jgi:hypothetical protein
LGTVYAFIDYQNSLKPWVMIMKKDSLICFRASKDLHKSLSQVAKQNQRSVSSMIEMALTNYLKERKSFPADKLEKRQYPRKSISVPTIINQVGNGQVGMGSISEISLCGVSIIIPKDFQNNIQIEAQGSRFEIVFNLPSENKPIKLSCESKRVSDSDDCIRVGATFVDAGFQNYKTLQSYLM